MPRTRRLLVVLALNLALVGALVAVGVTAHSLAVLAEGGDYLLDAAGVGVALLAIRMSARPVRGMRRGGAPRASDVAALVNSGWLLVLEVLVAAAAAGRLTTGVRQVDGLPVLVVSGIAALVMTGGALILRGDGDDEDEAGDHDLSVAAVLLDTIADAAAATGVAVAGAVILATGGWYWLDPAVALVIALVVAYHAIALIRKVLTRLRPTAADDSGAGLRTVTGKERRLRETSCRAACEARSECRRLRADSKPPRGRTTTRPGATNGRCIAGEDLLHHSGRRRSRPVSCLLP